MIQAEFFDIFGLAVFTILLISGIRILKSRDKSIRKYGRIILIISILGLIVDGYNVLVNFVLN